MLEETSIINMARGGVIERIDAEIGKAIANIHDLNTPPTKPRTVTVKIILRPNDQREQIQVSYEVDSKLAPKSPLTTSLSTGETMEGELYAVENTPNIPGQMALNGNEQEAPKVLKFG